MRRNLIDAGRTYHNRLWTDSPPVCAFSVFLLLFDTVLYETLFSSDLGFVLLSFGVFFPSPRLLFEHECVGLVASTPSSPLCLPSLVICFGILTFPLFISREKVPERAHQCPSLISRFLRYSSVLHHL